MHYRDFMSPKSHFVGPKYEVDRFDILDINLKLTKPIEFQHISISAH